MTEDFRLAPRIINSAISGTIAAICVYPLELIKTRLQTQSYGPGNTRSYNSITDAFFKIRKREGFTGLYKGLLFQLSFVTPELVLTITGNDFFRKLLHPNDNQDLAPSRQAIAAALTGLMLTTIATPMEYIRIQLQDEGRMLQETKSENRPTLNARTVIRDIVMKNGIRAPFKGLISCILRDVPFTLIYFPVFAFLYNMGPEYHDGRVDFGWTLLAGMIAGSAAAHLVTPMDVVKTRLQTTHTTGENIFCPGVIQCYKSIYRVEGFKAFFRGATCRLLINGLLFGITEMVYYFGVAEYILNQPIQKFIR